MMRYTGKGLFPSCGVCAKAAEAIARARRRRKRFTINYRGADRWSWGATTTGLAGLPGAQRSSPQQQIEERQEVAFQYVSAAPGSRRKLAQMYIVEGSNNHDVCLRIRRQDRTRGGYAVHPGKLEIHKHIIRGTVPVRGNGAAGVGAFANLFRVASYQVSNHPSHRLVVFHDQDSHNGFRRRPEQAAAWPHRCAALRGRLRRAFPAQDTAASTRWLARARLRWAAASGTWARCASPSADRSSSALAGAA
jgi:hypothetical protein